MAGHDIIVVGASAGGVEALLRVVQQLPSDLPAAVFVVLHLPSGSRSVLPELLTRAGPLPAAHAVHGQSIQAGRIYVAPPDRHMLIVNRTLHVSAGPRENGHRPAIDPLFRSAARMYGPRVLGIVLSGALDDGTAGLSAIKLGGGIAIVQDPDDALFPSMPSSALEHVAVDHVMIAEDIGRRLAKLVAEPTEDAPVPAPSSALQVETQMADMDPKAMHEEERPGSPSAFGCPECGGVLWELNDRELIRFRCRVGHAYSPDTLSAKQFEALEDALWVALRALEEQAALAQRLADQAIDRGQTRLARRFDERRQAAHDRAELIREVLVDNDAREQLTGD